MTKYRIKDLKTNSFIDNKEYTRRQAINKINKLDAEYGAVRFVKVLI